MHISPATRFAGVFRLPGDKSLSHRLALLGAMAEGRTLIHNYSTAVDCTATLNCLSALGIRIQREGATVTVFGQGPGALSAPTSSLDAGNSGSTLRMLAGVLAGCPFVSILSGDESLRRRPVERVAGPLRAMGAHITTTNGRPPMEIRGGELKGLECHLPVASAQVKTAVLLAGLRASGVTRVHEPALSRDHTERLLPAFGIQVQRQERTTQVSGGGSLCGIEFEVPGDVSSAAFFVVAALILPHSEILIENVLLNPTRVAFLDVLVEMGAHIETSVVRSEPEPVGWIRACSSRLGDGQVAAERVPALIDEVPALAVAAAFGQGEFRLAGARELRVKESDRLAALTEGLSHMGGRVEEREDGFVIRGGPRLHGAHVRSLGDHRIAMALAIAGLAASGTTHIEDAQCASVSFPEFFDLLAQGAH